MGLWAVHALVMRGARQAAFINLVTTAAKILPPLAFVLIAIFAFNHDKFALNLSAGRSLCTASTSAPRADRTP